MKLNIDKSVVYALFAVICWSTVATAFKMALSGMSFLMLLGISSFAASFSLLIILIWNGKIRKLLELDAKTLGLLAFKGSLNPFLYYLILFKAYELLPAQEALILNYTWPIMLVFFSIIFLKQKVLKFDIPSILICFTGVLLIATKGQFQNIEFVNGFGTFLALISSVVWAFYWIMNMKSSVDSSIQLFVGFSSGFILTSLTAVFYSSGFSIESPEAIWAGVYVGLFEMSIPFLLWQLALTKAKSSASVSRFVFLSPFISLIFIALILHEQIFWTSVLGLILIIAGILVQGLGKVSLKD